MYTHYAVCFICFWNNTPYEIMSYGGRLTLITAKSAMINDVLPVDNMSKLISGNVDNWHVLTHIYLHAQLYNCYGIVNILWRPLYPHHCMSCLGACACMAWNRRTIAAKVQGASVRVINCCAVENRACVHDLSTHHRRGQVGCFVATAPASVTVSHKGIILYRYRPIIDCTCRLQVRIAVYRLTAGRQVMSLLSRRSVGPSRGHAWRRWPIRRTASNKAAPTTTPQSAPARLILDHVTWCTSSQQVPLPDLCFLYPRFTDVIVSGF